MNLKLRDKKYQGVNDFKKDYQLRTNRVKFKIGDLVTYCHSILATWRNHFSKLLVVQEFNVVRQRQMDTAEPLVPESSAFDVEMAIEKMNRHILLSIDQIPAELIKTRCRTIRYDIHKLIDCIWNKEE
jgi:hypothetical protein